MTNLVEWSDALSVGIDEIDAQHKVLVGLVNEMHDVVRSRGSREDAASILRRLVEYTRIHFAVEESLMQLLGYPDLEAHRHEHRALLMQLKEFQQGLESDRILPGDDLMTLLRRWLCEHMTSSDQAYADYYRESGVWPQLKKRSLTSRLWNHLHG